MMLFFIIIILINVLEVKLTEQKIIDVTPNDLKLTRGGSINVNCTLTHSPKNNEDFSSSKLIFKLILPKNSNYTDTSKSISLEEQFDWQLISKNNVTIINKWTANLNYSVDSLKVENALLNCCIHNNLCGSAAISIGELPHTVVNVTCVVYNWTDLQCTYLTLHVNKIYTTSYNVYVKQSNSDTFELLVSNLTKWTFEKRNFVSEGLLGAIDLFFEGRNLGGTTRSEIFHINLKDHVVVPMVIDLHVEQWTNINLRSVGFTFRRNVKKDLLVQLEITCFDNHIVFETSHTSQNDIISINFGENELPAPSNCSGRVRLKPLDYGLFNEWSNIVLFATHTRVPLRNPATEKSFYLVHNCICSVGDVLCDVQFYFKPLTLNESSGKVEQYRMNITKHHPTTQSSASLSTSHSNHIFYFPAENYLNLTIKNISIAHDCCNVLNKFHSTFRSDLFESVGSIVVTLEAATSAGYNNLAPASLFEMPFRRCHDSNFITVTNKDITFHFKFVPELFDVIVINKTTVDIIWSVQSNKHGSGNKNMDANAADDDAAAADDDADDDVFYVVWCEYNMMSKTCKRNLDWKETQNVNKTNIFTLTFETDAFIYNYGISRGGGVGGIHWLDADCLFDSKAALSEIMISQSKINSSIIKVNKPICTGPGHSNYFRKFKANLFDDDDDVWIKEYENNFDNNFIELKDIEKYKRPYLVFTFYGWTSGDDADVEGNIYNLSISNRNNITVKQTLSLVNSQSEKINTNVTIIIIVVFVLVFIVVIGLLIWCLIHSSFWNHKMKFFMPGKNFQMTDGYQKTSPNGSVLPSYSQNSNPNKNNHVNDDEDDVTGGNMNTTHDSYPHMYSKAAVAKLSKNSLNILIDDDYDDGDDDGEDFGCNVEFHGDEANEHLLHGENVNGGVQPSIPQGFFSRSSSNGDVGSGCGADDSSDHNSAGSDHYLKGNVKQYNFMSPLIDEDMLNEPAKPIIYEDDNLMDDECNNDNDHNLTSTTVPSNASATIASSLNNDTSSFFLNATHTTTNNISLNAGPTIISLTTTAVPRSTTITETVNANFSSGMPSQSNAFASGGMSSFSNTKSASIELVQLMSKTSTSPTHTSCTKKLLHSVNAEQLSPSLSSSSLSSSSSVTNSNGDHDDCYSKARMLKRRPVGKPLFGKQREGNKCDDDDDVGDQEFFKKIVAETNVDDNNYNDGTNEINLEIAKKFIGADDYRDTCEDFNSPKVKCIRTNDVEDDNDDDTNDDNDDGGNYCLSSTVKSLPC